MAESHEYYYTWIIKVKFRSTFTGLTEPNMSRKIKTHQGSSVGSQQTRHTLQVKHMALSSPDEAGCKFIKNTGNVNNIKIAFK